MEYGLDVNVVHWANATLDLFKSVIFVKVGTRLLRHREVVK